MPKVIIDGVQYIPAPPMPAGKGLAQALEVRFDSDAGDDLTVRQYLCRLLSTLWAEQDSFSGKHPFGNSFWEYDLYLPLVKAGFIDGTIDEYGSVDVKDIKKAHAYVHDLILEAFAVRGGKSE